MATDSTIKLKIESGDADDVPANGDIVRGELILNTQRGKLWYGDNSNNLGFRSNTKN